MTNKCSVCIQKHVFLAHNFVWFVILFVSKLGKGVSDISYTCTTVHTKYIHNIQYGLLFFISKYFMLSLFTVLWHFYTDINVLSYNIMILFVTLLETVSCCFVFFVFYISILEGWLHFQHIIMFLMHQKHVAYQQKYCWESIQGIWKIKTVYCTCNSHSYCLFLLFLLLLCSETVKTFSCLAFISTWYSSTGVTTGGAEHFLKFIGGLQTIFNA